MDSDVGEPQPPIILDDPRCLSLTFDLRLPMDIAIRFNLSLGFLNLAIDSTNGDGFDLGSSSMGHPSVKDDAIFNT